MICQWTGKNKYSSIEPLIIEPRRREMTDKEAIIKAYGILWREVCPSKKTNAARRILRDRLTVEDRRKGVRFALKSCGDVSDSELLLMEELK